MVPCYGESAMSWVYILSLRMKKKICEVKIVSGKAAVAGNPLCIVKADKVRFLPHSYYQSV